MNTNHQDKNFPISETVFFVLMLGFFNFSLISAKSTSLDHLLDQTRIISPSHTFTENAHIKSDSQYQEMYQCSIRDSESFWLEQSDTLEWFKKALLHKYPDGHLCKNNSRFSPSR